jgi:penicillin amidase
VTGLTRIALRTGLVAVLLVAVLLVAGLVTVRRPLPSYAAEVSVPGLAGPVTIKRDEQGVPQIYADDPADLFYAQGYVHAQDRFFQMDVRRHITAGRVSELVGANETALAADKVVRTLGWRQVAEAELPLLNPQTRNYLQSYADGVNAYISSRSPGELSVGYVVLGTQVDLARIDPWTPVDSLAWLKAMAWDLRSNYDDELGRALAYGTVGNVDQVNLLYPPYPTSMNAPITPITQTSPAALSAALAAAAADSTATPAHPEPAPDRDAAGTPAPPAQFGPADLLAAETSLQAVSKVLAAVPETLGRGEGAGSNAWVVGGQLTESGEPLLAADPHLEATMPSVWYQAGLHCNEVSAACPFEVAGFTFAGMPGVIIGHNASISWGMANLAPDVTDFFLERTRGQTALLDGQWLPLVTRRETIKVAGSDPVTITVRSTSHGPLLSDVLSTLDRVGAQSPAPEGVDRGEGFDVALSWTALTPGRTADAIFAVNSAVDWEQFRAALALFDAPAQNVVFADTAGHIGYQAAGRVPTRPAGAGLGQADGTWPRPGWDSSWNWTGVVDFGSLPSVFDPPEGFIVAANQQAQVGSGLTADWDYGYRAQRIRSLILTKTEDGGKLTTADMGEIQLDTYNYFAAQLLVPTLLSTPVTDEASRARMEFTNEATRLLIDWDGTQEADSAAAAYYNAVWSNLLLRTFGDQLPQSVQPDGGSRWFEVMRGLLQQPNNPWWDDATTPTVIESRDQILSSVLVDARLELTASLGKDPKRWRWGDLHQLTARQQPLGAPSSPTVVQWLFNSDPLPAGGSNSTVNVGSWSPAIGSYDVTKISSMRMVVDLGELDASTWVDFTGVSGHPWSSHFGDQTETWLEGGSYQWSFTDDAIDATTVNTMKLSPQTTND